MMVPPPWVELAAPPGMRGARLSAVARPVGFRAPWGYEGIPKGAFVAIAAGAFTCALDAKGQLRCFGDGDEIAGAPTEGVFTAVDIGHDYACALDDAGAIHCWGDDRNGETHPPKGVFAQIATGGSHACALTPEGEAVCWGNNDYGQTTPP